MFLGIRSVWGGYFGSLCPQRGPRVKDEDSRYSKLLLQEYIASNFRISFNTTGRSEQNFFGGVDS